MVSAEQQVQDILKRRRERHVTGRFAQGLFSGLSGVARWLPQGRALRREVDVQADIPYLETGSQAHLLNVTRPRGAGSQVLPALLVVHGGGFRILSKDTHWMMSALYARMGFTVFSINYRLAPVHPYPAAVEDVCQALLWVLAHAGDFGGDASRLVLAGESAGGNLVTGLMLAACQPGFGMTCTEAVYEAAPALSAVLPACGLLQVSQPGRFLRGVRLPRLVATRIVDVSASYIGDDQLEPPGQFPMADPLCWLESEQDTARPLPPVFVFVGDRDPIGEDSHRLARALEHRGGVCRLGVYSGGHAFHGMFWKAKACWDDQQAFLQEHVKGL